MEDLSAQNITEIRWHGRGGQGAVASAQMFALAAIEDGKYAQAFPSFGPERRGAPVMAFTRISDEFIFIRSGITSPDIVVVLDPSVMSAVDTTEGLSPDGTLIVNTRKTISEVKQEFKISQKVCIVNASKIAHEEIGRPITNTTMMGALSRVSGLVSIDSLAKQVEEMFPQVAEKNVNAMKRAYSETILEGE
ncbi:MAG: 2-oxoacid:acceptor oxidoreductase family protein [Actinomycetota bacterium]|nr:2-oxoacid:acceptor oxidoreductase family protein [Actinomycetota bacterium]